MRLIGDGAAEGTKPRKSHNCSRSLSIWNRSTYARRSQRTTPPATPWSVRHTPRQQVTYAYADANAVRFESGWLKRKEGEGPQQIGVLGALGPSPFSHPHPLCDGNFQYPRKEFRERNFAFSDKHHSGGAASCRPPAHRKSAVPDAALSTPCRR